MWSLFSDGVFAFLFCAPLFSFEIAQTLWNIFCIHFCFRSICELIIVDSIILSLRGEKKSDGIEQTNAEGERERRKEVGDTEEQEQRERESVCKKLKDGKSSRSNSITNNRISRAQPHYK